MKKRLQIFLGGFISLAVCFMFVAGIFGCKKTNSESTDKNVKTISTKEELIAFRDAVNEGEDFSGTTVKLAADIDMTGYEWTVPIGTGEHKFEGKFDGQNHRIIALSNNGTSSPETATNATSGLTGGIFGFFGYTKGNVTIKNLKLNVNAYDENGVMFAGVVACSGYCKDNSENCNLKIEDVEVSGYLSAKDKVAGFVGQTPYSDAAGKTEIEDCTNKADVIASGRRAAGFIAGGGSNGEAINPIELEDCKNEGNITSGAWAGAFIASVNQTQVYNEENKDRVRNSPTFKFKNCANSGTISGAEVSQLTFDESAKYSIVENTSPSAKDYVTLQVLAAAISTRYYNNIKLDGDYDDSNLEYAVQLGSNRHFGSAVTDGAIESSLSYKLYFTAAEVNADRFACYIEVSGGVVAFGSVKQAVAAGLMIGEGKTYTIKLAKDCAEDVVSFLRDTRYNDGASTLYGSWRNTDIKFEVDENGHSYSTSDTNYTIGEDVVFSVK